MKRDLNSIGIFGMRGSNAPFGKEWRIHCGRQRRRFYVYPGLRDRAYRESCPAILILHGTLGSAQRICQETGFNEVADAAGIIAIYPDGVRRSWADGRGITPADLIGVDDVAFIDSVFHICTNEYGLDGHRVFLVGFSSGGFLAQRLAVEFPGRFAAMAVVSALLSKWLSNRLHSGCGLPVMFVHGTADPVIPYDGEGQERGAICSADESVRRWAECNGYAGKPSEVRPAEIAPDGNKVSITRYGPPGSPKPAILYTIEQGGHVWPGTRRLPASPRLGPACRNLDATRLIWNFISNFPRIP